MRERSRKGKNRLERFPNKLLRFELFIRLPDSIYWIRCFVFARIVFILHLYCRYYQQVFSRIKREINKLIVLAGAGNICAKWNDDEAYRSDFSAHLKSGKLGRQPFFPVPDKRRFYFITTQFSLSNPTCSGTLRDVTRYTMCTK